MKKRIDQLPSPSLPLSMMISESAYRVVVSVERLIQRVTR